MAPDYFTAWVPAPARLFGHDHQIGSLCRFSPGFGQGIFHAVLAVDVVDRATLTKRDEEKAIAVDS